MPNETMSPAARAAFEDALERIEACRREGKAGTTLDLKGLGLTTLPPEDRAAYGADAAFPLR